MAFGDFYRGKSVLVTGASAGIGAELAWQLGQAGARLTLAARRRERLEALAARIAAAGGEAPQVVECDVARDRDLERAVVAAVARFERLEVAFANAGFGVTGPLRRLALDDYRRQFETNVFGVLRTVYAVLPELERNRGNLVVISSVSGWVAAPGASAYSMSKFALRALATALRAELAPAGVTVTLISPGFVASDFRRVDNHNLPHGDRADTAPAWLQMPADRAVRSILRAAARGKRERIVTGHGKALVALERFLPGLNRALLARMARHYRRWQEPS
ncbi:MAG: SDR family NAD(P)-dependent oxidoreductase [Terriglobales bacterium]